MLDIVAVLEWFRDNIANFGGDPANVMIHGQSGGGGKVSTLMAMPSAKGLFHRAVVQSGATLRSGSSENADELAAAGLAELGIAKAQIDKLHSLPASDLMRVQVAVQRRLGTDAARRRTLGWGPIPDGKTSLVRKYKRPRPLTQPTLTLTSRSFLSYLNLRPFCVSFSWSMPIE